MLYYYKKVSLLYQALPPQRDGVLRPSRRDRVPRLLLTSLWIRPIAPPEM